MSQQDGTSRAEPHCALQFHLWPPELQTNKVSINTPLILHSISHLVLNLSPCTHSLTLHPLSALQLLFGMAISKAIAALKKAFPSHQLTACDTEEFQKLNKSYLSMLQSDLEPAAIFLPHSRDEVAEFKRIIEPFALNGDAQFAVRGAGQQPLPGCSNISSNGITIDLRFLTGIELKDGSVSLGAGERWGPVYEKLAEHGLGVTGSRSALGGIRGLALAGMVNFRL